MEKQEVMEALAGYGSESTRKTLLRHGATEPLDGVKVADLKKLAKKIKTDHRLALALFDSGHADAMYLAGLIANADEVSPEELQHWAEAAEWYMVGEYMVAGLAAESPHGWELGKQWIDDEREHVAAIGWATLGGWLSYRSNEEIDTSGMHHLLKRISKTIHESPNRVRYTMNNFVIATGSYMPDLLAEAKAVAETIGKVSVNMGDTACKVPLATDYIAKVENMGRVGKKRPYVRC